MDKFRFSKTNLREIMPGDTEQRFGDTEQPGLIFRVMPSGHKSFHLQRKIKGRTTRVSIGPFPELTVDQARVKARELLNKIMAGEDINEKTSTMTVNELFADYQGNFNFRIEAGERRPTSIASIQSVYRIHLRPLIGTQRLVDLNSKIAILVSGELKKKSPAIYNRGMAICKSLINYAIANEYTKENPFDRHHQISIKPRERILKPDEMTRFFESISMERPIYRDVIMILLFTGQRKTCVLSMEWDEIDITNRMWRIPTKKMKGKTAHSVPLIDILMEILQRRLTIREPGERFVFPSKISKTGHIVADGTGFWSRIIERAGLYSEEKSKTLCIHDLRRTLGSWQAMGGESLLMISKMLGHKNINVTASTYAHLQVGGVRIGMESAATAMLSASNGGAEQPDKLAGMVAGLSEEERGRLLKLLSGNQA
jgi:integrase